MIELKDLSVRIPGGSLTNISEKLVSGNTYGIVGDRADGHSLLLSLLSGVLTPDAGEVRINGFSMKTETRRAKWCVGVLPCIEELPSELTVAEYLIFLSDAHSVHYEKALRRMGELLDEWGMYEKRDRLIGKLNVSERRILSFLSLLLPDPDVYLMEFPTALSERERHDIALFFESISEDKTVFLAATDQILLHTHCQKVLLFEEGYLKDILPPDDERIAAWKPKGGEENRLPHKASRQRGIGSILLEGTKEEILNEKEDA